VPTFDISAPDGKKFRVEAPEGATAQDALARVMRQQAQKSAPSFSESAGDFFKSIPRGIVQGMGATLSATGQSTMAEGAADPEMVKDIPTPAQATDILEKNVTGDLHKPTTRAGRFGETTGEFLGNPLSYVGPGGPITKGVMAVTGALGSEAGGQMFEGTNAEPYARIIGGIIGGTAPRAAARTITPNPISVERQGLVDTLRSEGIEPTAGQATGSRALRYAESELGQMPGSGGAREKAVDRISSEFTRAALKRVGEDADRATPEVVDRAFTRIGSEFDRLAANNKATIDQQYAQDILKAQDEYNHLFVDPFKKPMVQAVVDQAFNQMAKSRTMDGEVYKAVRSRIERMRRGQKQDPEMSMFLAEVRDAMDGLMERSIAKANPSDLGAWRDVRNQYRNMLVIETAMAGGGEQVAQGVVTPAKLRQAAVGQDKRGYVRGRGDFTDLSHAGNAILAPLPESGTAARGALTGISAGLGAAGGAALGHGAAVDVPAAIAGSFAPGVAGRFLLSDLGQQYLKNQALTHVLEGMPSASSSALRGGLVADMALDRGSAAP